MDLMGKYVHRSLYTCMKILNIENNIFVHSLQFLLTNAIYFNHIIPQYVSLALFMTSLQTY